MSVALPATLPAPADAQLPATYTAAQKALAECSRVDECKDWSDKAQALASYARQAKDSTLHNLALRIQSRAQRRMGELLKQIPRGDEATRYGQAGALPPVTRGQAAADAGLSEHQRKTAQRIASIPAPDFEAAVESSKPPSITELAIRGTVTKPPVPEPTPAAPAIAQRAQSLLRDLAAFCGTCDATAVAVSPAIDADLMRGAVKTIDSWLDRFVTRLPSDTGAF